MRTPWNAGATLLAGLLLCASAAVEAAHAAPAAEAKGPAHVLRMAFPIAETSLDPARINDEYSVEIVSNIFESPLAYDYLARPVKLKPLTAAALPEVSPDFKQFTVRIKPGIFFAADPAFKGLKPGEKRELVAADYAYALKRHFDPQLRSPHYANLENEKILGLEALRQRSLKNGKPFDYDAPVEGLQTPDRYTLVIKLDRASPRFAHQLTQPLALAVAREVVEAYGDAVSEHPVGTGPFVLKDWRRASRLVLERNPSFRETYFDEEAAADDTAAQAVARQLKGRRLPLVDRVEVSIVTENQPRWLAFLGNEFDFVIVPNEYANIAAPRGQLAPNLAKRGMALHRNLLSDVIFSYFNMEDPVVGGYTPDKVALRRAIGLAYDNAEEARQLRRRLAVPAQGIVTPNTFGYQPDFKTEMSEYSPAKARALLDMYGYVDRDGDGWRDLPDGSPLRLQYHTQPDSNSRAFNELWRKHMAALQVRIEFKSANWPDNMKAARAGRLMMWMLSWTSGIPDADSMLSTGFSSAKGEDNLSRFSLPEYDRVVQRIQVLADGPERLALIQEAERLLTAYMPMKAHVHRIRLRLAQPWLQGYLPHPFMTGYWRFVDSQPPGHKP